MQVTGSAWGRHTARAFGSQGGTWRWLVEAKELACSRLNARACTMVRKRLCAGAGPSLDADLVGFAQGEDHNWLGPVQEKWAGR